MGAARLAAGAVFLIPEGLMTCGEQTEMARESFSSAAPSARER